MCSVYELGLGLLFGRVELRKMDPSPSLVCRRFCRCRFDVDVRGQLFSIVFDVDV